MLFTKTMRPELFLLFLGSASCSTIDKSPSSLIKAAVEIANNEFSTRNLRNSPVCTLMHKDLTALEVKYLELNIISDGIAFVENKLQGRLGPMADAERVSHDCLVFIGRELTQHQLQLAQRYLPLGSYILVNNTMMKEAFERKDLPKTNIISVHHNSKNGMVEIRLECKNGQVSQFWTPGQILKQSPFNDCPASKEQIEGLNLKAIAYGGPPYIMGSNSKDKKSQVIGVNIEVMKLLADHFHFQVEIEMGQTWGQIPDSGYGQNSTGLYGQVIRHEIHFGIVKAIMAARRMRYFDYSTFQFFGMGKLATLKPKPVDEFLKIFAPLRPITWTSFLTVFICVSSTMVVLKSIHPRVDKDSVCSFQLFYGTFQMLFEWSHNDSWVNPIRKTLSGRAVLVAWLIAVTFFHFFYSSTLRATLLAVAYNKPVDTVKDAIKAETPIYWLRGVGRLSVKPEIIQASKTAAELKRTYGFTKDGAALPDHIVDSVLNQDAFVLMADGVFSYFVNGFVKTHGYQPFYHGKEVVGTFQGRFAMSKEHYPWKKQLIDPATHKLIESGIVKKLFSKYNPPAETGRTIGREDQTLDLWHFSSLFLFYGVFALLSILIFVFEKFSKSEY